MKNWLLTRLRGIPLHYRWSALLFVQIWVWPQVLDPHMSAGIGFSTIVTMAICVIFTMIKTINAYEDRDN